jgi:hypothetical protein
MATDLNKGQEDEKDRHFIAKITGASMGTSAWRKGETYGISHVYGGVEAPTPFEYQDKLDDPRWIAFSKRVRQLRKSCEQCGSHEHLEVHHKRYLPGLEPWEHPIYEVLLVCANCHRTLHQDGANTPPSAKPSLAFDNPVPTGTGRRDLTNKANDARFEVGTVHRNRRGMYVVVSATETSASIRSEDGAMFTCEIANLRRIEDNLAREYPSLLTSWMQPGEARDYLASRGVSVDIADPFELCRKAVSHRDIERFQEACRVLRESCIPFDPSDKDLVFRAAREHEETLRIGELHKHFLMRRQLSNDGRRLVNVADEKRKPHRSAVCFDCTTSLDNFLHRECSACGWIVCPNCGACGCGFESGGSRR